MLAAVLKPKSKKAVSKSSRKGKKAWRKNVDITEVEEALEKIRDEEKTLGGKLGDISTESLFSIDVKGDSEVKKKVDKKSVKLHIDQVLENRSKIPGVFSKPRPNYGKNNTSKYTKMMLEKLAKKNYIEKNANNTESSDVVMKTGEYDLWAQVADDQSEDVSHSIMKQKKIKELLMIAHEEEVIKLKKTQHINSKLPCPVVVPSEQNIENMIDEIDEKSSEEDEIELEEIIEKATSQTKEQRRKTKAERNKEKRKRVKIREEEQRKTQKDFMKKFEKLPEIIKTVENECAEHEKMMIERTKLAEEMTKMPKKKIGKYRVRKAPIDVKLTEDLEGTLRLLKPEGNLFRDRMISYEERNIIEPRVPVR
ncbi:36309_t:CDS:2 [Gigaspora margarita]|uniref:Ribosome biogenesis protein NOP53 n=1 Tax=Gigaspora margarita TaxID=4874 RepID=A0ABN7UEG0_GIGMA|nr:36309_t:CDS:2 [Gigaspora margarita]